jgi:hypothetical protein
MNLPTLSISTKKILAGNLKLDKPERLEQHNFVKYCVKPTEGSTDKVNKNKTQYNNQYIVTQHKNKNTFGKRKKDTQESL